MDKNAPHIERIAPSVFTIIGREGATNFGIVRGTDGTALLIDADIRRIDEIEAALGRMDCQKIKYLLNTHENFDHSSANDYFASNHDVVVVSSNGCLEALQDDGAAKFAEMSGRAPELVERFAKLEMGLPAVTFGTSGNIVLPGATIRLRYCGSSHSRGDTVAFVEQAGILFAGDLLYHQVHPVTIYGDIPKWIETLDALGKKHFEHIVPGHGPIPTGEEEGKNALRRFRNYLEEFHQQLLEASAGRRSAAEVEAYMQSGAHESLGKSYMVKRNTSYFLKTKR